MPGHLLLVPQHPEVAQEAGKGGDDPTDVANERRAPAQGAAGVIANDPDTDRSFADSLARRAAFEIAEVGEVDDGADEGACRYADEGPDDDADDAEEHEVDEPAHEPLTEARSWPAGASEGLIRRCPLRAGRGPRWFAAVVAHGPQRRWQPIAVPAGGF